VREPSTKADEIARALEDAIPARELLPGSLLRQEQLSEQFGVSRTPIRETLLFVVRAALESCAARDAIVRRLVEAHVLDSARLLERALERAGYGRPPQFGHRLSWRSA
jgi:GntR family transcriptional regulator, rspAB operon transcriptional repressor